MCSVNGNPVSFVDPFGLAAERGGTKIVAAPEHPKDIPYDVLKQILKVREDEEFRYYYDTDYKNHASIKIDDKGNVTYTFYKYDEGLLWDTYLSTQYYFEVKKASYWQSKLDVEVGDLHKLFDNEAVDWINNTLDSALVPGSGLPIQIEFVGQMFTLTTTALSNLTKGDIKHNTKLSQYLYDKVIYKKPDEDVAILKSVKTISGTRWFWEDYLDLKVEIDRNMY